MTEQVSPIDNPDEGLRMLLNDNLLKIELRGYEVARLRPWGWEVCMKLRPTEAGLLQGLKEVKWWSELHPELETALRPIISLDPSALVAEVESAEPESAPPIIHDVATEAPTDFEWVDRETAVLDVAPEPSLIHLLPRPNIGD